MTTKSNSLYQTIVDEASSTDNLIAGGTYLIDNGASLVTLTLPASPVAGDIYRVIGTSSGGWTIAQNASQLIRLPNGNATTTGAGGSISSNSQYDTIAIQYTETANTFIVIAVTGNPTYV
jgi:hypothetical protein